jgi:hypothetical protein
VSCASAAPDIRDIAVARREFLKAIALLGAADVYVLYAVDRSSIPITDFKLSVGFHPNITTILASISSAKWQETKWPFLMSLS